MPGARPPLRALAAIYNALPGGLQHALLAAAHQRFLVGVVGCGVTAEGRIVLARHRFGSPAWRFLGGLLERHEDPAASLAREIAEETGLAVEVGPLLAASNGRRFAHVELVYAYRVTAPLPLGPSDELREVRAFALDALPPMREDHRRLVMGHAASALAWSAARRPDPPRPSPSAG